MERRWLETGLGVVFGSSVDEGDDEKSSGASETLSLVDDAAVGVGINESEAMLHCVVMAGGGYMYLSIRFSGGRRGRRARGACFG